jgi:hypothetical protein
MKKEHDNNDDRKIMDLFGFNFNELFNKGSWCFDGTEPPAFNSYPVMTQATYYKGISMLETGVDQDTGLPLVPWWNFDHPGTKLAPLHIQNDYGDARVKVERFSLHELPKNLKPIEIVSLIPDTRDRSRSRDNRRQGRSDFHQGRTVTTNFVTLHPDKLVDSPDDNNIQPHGVRSDRAHTENIGLSNHRSFDGS